MKFVEYKNRYGKRMVLLDSAMWRFSEMASALLVKGIEIEMTDGWRGKADQEKALADGNSKAGFGNSPHNYGAAFDCAPIIDGKLCWPEEKTLWNEIGKAGMASGLEWGGNFKSIMDNPHFQLPAWRNMGLELHFTEPLVA